jgi:dUTP pyrophosphatase
MKLNVKRLRGDAVLLSRAHHNDAGIDLFSCGEHSIAPHTTFPISTGIALEIPDGYVGLVWDKSSIGSKGIKTLGGVVDAGYREEVKVIVHNLNTTPYIFSHGDKVAQILIQKVELFDISEVEELSDSLRGVNGFGSTGK